MGAVLRTLLLLAAVLVIGCKKPPSPPPPPPPPAPKAEPSQEERALAAITPEDDAKRETLIADGQKSGWLGAIDYSARTIAVGPGFGALDFKMKEAVIWAVVLNGMRKTMDPRFEMTLVDPKTNKTVGTYTTTGRLQLR